MLDPDAIYFPKAEAVPKFAMAFTNLMFAHAEFEEQVRDLETAIKRTRPKRPHAAKTGGVGDARQRPKRMAKLIKDRPGLVTNQETKQIVEILKTAIGPCDKRNLFAHGRWWRFYPKTSTIRIRGERKGKPKAVDCTETEILGIADELRGLVLDLYKVRAEIERRRGDHDIPI